MLVEVVEVVEVVEIDLFDNGKLTDSTSIISSFSSVSSNKILRSSSKQHSSILPILSSISIINNSDSDSINIAPSSIDSVIFQSRVNSPTSFTEASISPDTTDWGYIIINIIVTKKNKRNNAKYFLKKKINLLFLKYLIIFLTSSSFNFDKCDLTCIFKYSAASSISFDFFFNFFANSNTFTFINFVNRYLQDIILIFQVLKRLVTNTK